MTANGQPKIDPFDLQAELGVLGTMAMAGLDPSYHGIIERMVSKLQPSDFYDDGHGKLFGHLRHLFKYSKIDATLLVNRLKTTGDYEAIGGSAYLSKVINAVPSAAHGDYYADIVKEKAERREWELAIVTTHKAIADGADISSVHERLESFMRNRNTSQECIGSFSTMAKKEENKELRPAVIDNIVREGETINIVSDSKVGKTWFVHGLSLAICSGRDWFEFPVSKGKVLILDNELHEPTLVHRVRQIANVLQLGEAEFSEQLHVECFRGRLIDIHAVCDRLRRIKPGTYKLVILDSLYRFAPKGFDENSNAATTEMYNLIDAAAAHLQAAVVCVRHSSKGNQSSKSVTDTGAGAGAQSRAVDAHIVLRAHEEEGAFVVGAALRSFPRLEPFVIRFDWPIFFRDPDLDPLALAPDKPRKPKATEPLGLQEPEWNVERFVAEFVTKTPQPRETIILAATRAGLSKATASTFFRVAEGSCQIHLHRGGDKRQKLYANVAQFVIADTPESVA